MKKRLLFLLIAIIIVVIIVIALLRVGNSGEDSWIKNEKGIYVKHGNPAKTPNEVLEQQVAISCAMSLYSQTRASGREINSQCLGRCQDFSVDIVHVPRTSDDDLVENQCSDFRNKLTNHFIELDKNGEIVRIV